MAFSTLIFLCYSFLKALNKCFCVFCLVPKFSHQVWSYGVAYRMLSNYLPYKIVYVQCVIPKTSTVDLIK